MKLNDAVNKLNDPLRKEIDFAYKSAKIKFPNIRFPCYGGRIYRYFFSLYDEYLHFYLTEKSILYTTSGTSFSEIPLRSIRKISLQKSTFIKPIIHIRLIADKKYHFFIYCNEHFSTELTGDAIKNANDFIDALKASVDNNS